MQPVTERNGLYAPRCSQPAVNDNATNRDSNACKDAGFTPDHEPHSALGARSREFESRCPDQYLAVR